MSSPTINGSSPRARGTVYGNERHWSDPRFIPARAGNGQTSPAHPRWVSVHPRARGERQTMSRIAPASAGSSPRARGTVAGQEVFLADQRFIPARAGNGRSTLGRRTDRSVHPRARGERLRPMCLLSRCGGSSPRARGTALLDSQLLLHARFIPARAGNGPCASCLCLSRTVHPRARGERSAMRMLGPSTPGSSPRARGTGYQGRHCPRPHRFIPARAGNGRSAKGMSLRATVHPRARGERSFRADLRGGCGGSSPRARGTVGKDLDALFQRRFIPARAGNGMDKDVFLHARKVHPRARGERSLVD